MITCEDRALEAMKEELVRQGSAGPVRIELCFTGCCDASLGLRVDSAREEDLVQEIAGVTFVVSPEVFEAAGDISVGYCDDASRRGFILSSASAVSEWQGFAPCSFGSGG
jgi:Fe-S cluster assembly iron-binding protein IscA